MKTWHILNRDGSQQEAHELPTRPDDAKPDDGAPFRPWYKDDEHIHVENGAIVGLHAFGELNEVQDRLEHYLAHEAHLLHHFGGNDDILAPDADAFLT